MRRNQHLRVVVPRFSKKVVGRTCRRGISGMLLAVALGIIVPPEARADDQVVTSADQVVYDHVGPVLRSWGAWRAPWGAHEGRLHGVPDGYDWAAGARPGAWTSFGANKAIKSWGQAYESSDGSMEKRVRIQLRKHTLYVFANGAWTISEIASENVNISHYPENFVGAPVDADSRRVEDAANGGGISVTMKPNYNIHWYPGDWPRPSIPKGAKAFFITCEMRLIPADDPSVNLANAKYLAGVSADLYPTSTWPEGPSADLSIPRHKFITANWRTFTAYVGGSIPTSVTAYRNDIASRALPPGVKSFSTQDIGGPVPTGSAVISGTALTVTGGGADIWGVADQFRFIWQTVSGNCDIIVRVDSQAATDPWAKAGIMIRGSTATGSPHASAFLTPGFGATFQSRTASNGWSTDVPFPALGSPIWLRLSRRQNTFTASQSIDGRNWVSIAGGTVSLPSQVLVGIAVTSHKQGIGSAATFSQYLVTTTSSVN